MRIRDLFSAFLLSIYTIFYLKIYEHLFIFARKNKKCGKLGKLGNCTTQTIINKGIEQFPLKFPHWETGATGGKFRAILYKK